jgi:hypothetical protein
LGLGVSACDGVPRARDASAPPATQTAEVSVRFDVNPTKLPAVSVLAFQASAAGVAPRDVLGIVDPLAAAEPERDCELRDVDLSASALVARGGSIELQEMGGIGIALGSTDPAAPAITAAILRPFPRLYPDVATVVGGVVAEAGPLPLSALPDRISLLTADSDLAREELAVPAAPRILTVNGAPLAAGAKIDAAEGLTLGVSGGPGTIVEIRPFGATAAVACVVPAASTAPAATDGESTLVVPRVLLARLSGGAGAATLAGVAGGGAAAPIPASLEVLRRGRARVASLGTPSRLSVEVRSSTAVELRP